MEFPDFFHAPAILKNLQFRIYVKKSAVIIVMAYILPENWDESAFIEDMGQHPELYDIGYDCYSNNKHRRSIFRQIGTTHGVDGMEFYL